MYLIYFDYFLILFEISPISERRHFHVLLAVQEEVKPKYVNGTKRYGRRSRPDKNDLELTADLEDSPAFDKLETNGVRRAKLRRSTSLESVEVKYVHNLNVCAVSSGNQRAFKFFIDCS